jgi:uncharacterized RDD family membrane protein YckC
MGLSFHSQRVSCPIAPVVPCCTAPLLVSMNSPDTQPGLDPPGVDPEAYFDPDAADTSEQEFSASLEAPAERPRFVLDEPSEPATTECAEPGVETASSQEVVTGEPERVETLYEPDSKAKTEPEEAELDVREHDWRGQVSAKVSNYRSRKPRIDRYPSLQLGFATSPQQDQKPPEAVPDAPFEISARVEHPGAASSRVTSVALEATARVLEFPRSAVLRGRDDELAEPVMGRPRIVEAPELLPPPPALGGILIEPAVAVETERRPGFDVPLQSSPFSRRLLAGAIDATVVAIALVAFAYIFFRISGAVLASRIAAEATAALLAVLWPVYQYAFLVVSKTTPGLRLAKLEVTRFDGGPASRSLRRWRVLASLLSCASLGLGYAWCFLDEDRLSWHDRITRTHLGSVPSTK